MYGMAAGGRHSFFVLNHKLYPFSAKKSSKVLPFEKMYLLLRCILSKVKNNIN